MSATLSERELGIVEDVVKAVADELRLADDGKLYVKRWATWRLRWHEIDPARWTGRPRCPYNITLGTLLRRSADAALNVHLANETRPELRRIR